MADPLLTSAEVSDLLQVHPKQVYRLLARGLPGHRVGREWRFDRAEVLRWVAGDPVGSDALAEEPDLAGAPPLLAANGDLAIELLLATLASDGPPLGFVLADRDRGLDRLARGEVLLAGHHGRAPPDRLRGVRLARIHLVVREVGLVAARGSAVPGLAALAGVRFASRPRTAGIRGHLEAALREERLDASFLDRSTAHASHRDVVHAVARGDADAGLATRAWADRLGLAFRALGTEPYGLLVRARDLGDPRVVRVCEIAQGPAFRTELARIAGYDASHAGEIQFWF